MKNRQPNYSKTAAMLFVVAVLVGLFDPYTFGDEGGELGFHSHTWQVSAAVLQALLLVVASHAACSAAHRRAQIVGVTEGVVFLLLNVLYILRDGATRFAAGYTADTTVIVAVAIGLATRCAAIGLLFSRANHRSPKD